MSSVTFLFILVCTIAILFLVLNFVLAPHNPKIWLGKSKEGEKLSNSGKALKLLVLSYSRKAISGWTNYSGTVTSHKMSENEMDNRGSKSIFYKFVRWH